MEHMPTRLLFSINFGVIKKAKPSDGKQANYRNGSVGECWPLQDKSRDRSRFQNIIYFGVASFSCGWWFITEWWHVAIGRVQNKTRMMHLCLVFVLHGSRCATGSYSAIVSLTLCFQFRWFPNTEWHGSYFIAGFRITAAVLPIRLHTHQDHLHPTTSFASIGYP